MFFTQNTMLIIYGLFVLFECTLALQLLEFQIPAYLPLGTRASLSCRWQLGPTDVLYSVKWYKDGKEFFRHVPRDNEPRRMFPLPGVDVEEFDASGSQIVLAAAVLDTGGRYRCEVSGEGPLFLTVSDHSDVLVVALPNHGPILSGVMSSYRLGDRLIMNCTSGYSLPPTNLAWYLNGEPLPPGKPKQWTDNGLVTSSLILDFVVEEMHFQKNILKVKCLATISPIYWRSNEESVVLDNSRASERLDKRNANRVTRLERVQANTSGLVQAAMILVYLVVVVNFCMLS